jgi:ribonuclease Z
MAELTILGTASMVPTKERNVQAFYLEFEGEGMLFDCGEGTQRQMNVAGISRAKVRRIFITHWHGDHVAGLIGLIQTIGNSNYTETLRIYGPRETRKRMAALMAATIFENKIAIEVEELDPKDDLLVAVDAERYQVVCANADHGIPCLAYAWHEKDRVRVDMASCKKLGIGEGPLVGKLSRGQSVEFQGKTIRPQDVTYRVAGKKVVFVPDTQPHPNLVLIAQFADVLVCESTFGSDEEEKAQQFRHMTAQKAARVAADAQVQRLILTHFSQRYAGAGVQHLVEEARVIFPNAEAAFDLMKITL